VERLLSAERAAHPAFPGSIDPEVLAAAAVTVGAVPARVGPWRLVREIGRGGMGQVFLAERSDGQYQQRAAVKLLKRGIDSEAIVARFLRERQILAGLDHPNVARLLDGGIAEDGRPYFVMEHVDGQPITRFADDRRLPIDDRLDLFRTVCLALEYAHRNLVVHRDLKPSNILVTTDGRPKLLDFGIAKLLSGSDGDGGEPSLTDAGARLMTPEYAAPEQFRGGPITTSTDVFGLGAVLYELLAGRRPHGRYSSTDLDPRSRDEEPPPLSAAASEVAGETAAARSTDAIRLRRRLAGDLETIVATALRTSPERRYSSVGDLREDIRRHQERIPVKARPDTLGYRVSRFVGRYRMGVAVTAAVALLLAAFGVTAMLQARALEVERDRARQEAAAAQQVADFLVAVFEVADPMRGGLGDSTRARTLLDRGAERITADLAGQPELEARMLGVIGRAYDNLGRSDLAEPMILRAMDLQRAEPAGEASPAFIAGLRQLAAVRSKRGNYAGAREAIRQAIGVQARTTPGDSTMLDLLMELSDAFHMDGRLDSANAVVARVVARFDSIPPEDVRGSRGVLRRMVAVLGYSDDWERLDTLNTWRVEAEGAVEGVRSESVAVALTDWAAVRKRRGDLPGADSMLTAALDIYRERGLQTIPAGRTLINLAELSAERGVLARADSLYRSAIDLLRLGLGEDHMMVAVARGGWAGLLHRTGRYDEAVASYQLVLAPYRKRSATLAYVPVAEWRMAEVLRKGGRLDESAAAFARALRGHEERFPPGYLFTAWVRLDYARLLVSRGRSREADSMLKLALPVLVKRWGEQDSRVIEARDLLAAAQEGTR
jgi:tetratricopeptide (TPR) repeat protein/tRNA A-37 threonylcarbamoyl transferase component Bud32